MVYDIIEEKFPNKIIKIKYNAIDDLRYPYQISDELIQAVENVWKSGIRVRLLYGDFITGECDQYLGDINNELVGYIIRVEGWGSLALKPTKRSLGYNITSLFGNGFDEADEHGRVEIGRLMSIVKIITSGKGKKKVLYQDPKYHLPDSDEDFLIHPSYAADYR